MADPLHDRLSALWRDVPIPPLAAVRARGKQRRTRTRAALAGGTAALAALGVLAGAALAGGSGGGPESLQPAPVATAPATPEPRPAPAPREWEVTSGFLLPEQASAAEMPGWREVSGDGDRPILDACGNGDTPLDDAVLDSDTNALGSQREAGGSSLTQQVLRYRSAAQAAEAFEAWSERVRTCPRESTPDGDLTWSVVEGGRTDDTDEMAVRRVPCQAGACSDQLATYALVARVGDGLTLVRYEMAEDGDPAEHVRPLLIAVVDRLRGAVQG